MVEPLPSDSYCSAPSTGVSVVEGSILAAQCVSISHSMLFPTAVTIVTIFRNLQKIKTKTCSLCLTEF